MARVLAILLVGACITLMLFLLCRPARQPEPTQALPQYTGKTFDRVVTDLGQPLRTESFKMGQALDQFRGPLQKIFPLNKPGNEKIEIKEAVWKDGDYYITIWFNKVGDKWVAIDGVRWHKDIRF